MQESSRGADPTARTNVYTSLCTQANHLKQVRIFLIGYRSGGTPDILRNLHVRDGIAGRRRGSNACQRPGDPPALRVACRCSLVGFDRQHILARPVGPSSTTTPAAEMTGPQDQAPVPPVTKPITYEELTLEHKQKYDEVKAQFEADLISSFERTCNHGQVNVVKSAPGPYARR